MRGTGKERGWGRRREGGGREGRGKEIKFNFPFKSSLQL